MAYYRIYHPENGKINVSFFTRAIKFKHVCSISANSLDELMPKLIKNILYLNIRNTFSGDIVEDVTNNKKYFITKTGFKEIHKNVRGIRPNKQSEK